MWGDAGERAQRTAPEEAAWRHQGSVKHTGEELGLGENVAPATPGPAGQAAELTQYGEERYIHVYVSESSHENDSHIHHQHWISYFS